MLKKLIHFLGKFLIVLGACMSLPLIIALAYDEKREAWAFLISIIVCFIIGIAVDYAFKTQLEQESLDRRDSYMLVSVAWIVASLVGCIPYMASGIISNFFLAFFESCSGFTTTGASCLTDIEILPRSILIWRCFSQWLGGMGIIVLFVALLPKLGAKAGSISAAETPGPISSKIAARQADNAQNLYAAYITLTILLFILLWVSKMNAFDAISHAFATMATGGFTTHNEGLAYFDSYYIYGVIGFFAFLAGTNFVIFFDILGGKASKILRDEEFKAYITIIGVSAVLIGVSLKLSGVCNDPIEALVRGLFQSINTLSKTGYLTGEVNWTSFCLLLLVFLMAIGGCSSSTAGGLKISRMLVSFKIVRAEIRRRTHDNINDDIKLNNHLIPGRTLSYIYTYSTLYFATIGIGTLIVSIAGGGSAVTNFLTIISCISSLGPGLDSMGLICQYHMESPICLLTYNIIMIAGRLEITTLLVLLSRHFWNPDRRFY